MSIIAISDSDICSFQQRVNKCLAKNYKLINSGFVVSDRSSYWWAILEEEKLEVFPETHIFTRVSPKAGDWVAWYMDGNLMAEGHSVDVWSILDSMADVFPNRVESMEISDERAAKRFDIKLEDLIGGR